MESEPIPLITRGNVAIRFQWRKKGSFEPSSAMYENALMFFQVRPLVELDFVQINAGCTGKAASRLLDVGFEHPSVIDFEEMVIEM